MKSLIVKTITVAVALISTSSLWALSSDKDQPVSITADNVDYNFATGERIYEGNVHLIQGSLEVTANKLIAEFNGDKFDKATATGTQDKRATFKQRPDGKDDDVIGIGDTLIYDETNQKMEIITNAELTQANQKATGAKIVYDIVADKMNVTGGGVQHDAKKNSSVSASNAGGRSKLIFSKEERAENKLEESSEAVGEALDNLLN